MIRKNKIDEKKTTKKEIHNEKYHNKNGVKMSFINYLHQNRNGFKQPRHSEISHGRTNRNSDPYVLVCVI